MDHDSKDIRWLGEDHGPEHHFRIGTIEDELVAEWSGLARLRSARDGAHSHFEIFPRADRVRAEKVRSGLASGLLRHLQGKITLHAASVACEGIALACIGASRAGKSTAIAELTHRASYDLLADDMSEVEWAERGPLVLPSTRDHWLFPDSRRALGLEGSSEVKERTTTKSGEPSAAALRAIVEMVFDDALIAPVTTRLRGHRVLECLAPSLVRFAIDDPEVQARDFETMRRLAQTTSVYRLARPRRFDLLRDTGDTLERLLREARECEHEEDRDAI